MITLLATYKRKCHIYRPLVRAVAFLGVFAVLLTVTSNIFIPKHNIRENGINYFNARGFYGEPINSLDIIAVGNSDLYSAFSPMVLWRNQGYASYVSGEARQTVRQAYILLKEALTCQNPKLVIFETDSIFEGGLDPMRLNISISNGVQNAFPVVEFHDRWKSLLLEDFTKKPLHTWKSKSKGFGISNKIDPYYGNEYMIPTSEKEAIKRGNLMYLNKIAELCAEKNIPLLFIEMPTSQSWNYARHNSVSEYAKQKNITFLDLNLCRDEIGLNWLTDTRDKGYHLNSSGAEKVTTYIGQYISQNYPVPDHRNDKEYSDEWNAELEEYEKKVTLAINRSRGSLG